MTACASESRVTVLIDAQPGVRAAAEALQVRVFGSDATLRLDDTRELGPETAWPLRLPLMPEGGDAARTWLVEATLTDAAGSVLAMGRSRGGYVEGGSREALLCLFDGCSAELCGATESDCLHPFDTCLTCRAGTCAAATAMLVASGTSPSCPFSECAPTGSREVSCDDGRDDDCDGQIDCADPECGCDAGVDAGPCTPKRSEDTPAACGNDLDDDCDGLVDCRDEGCHEEACGPGGLRCCGMRCVDTWSEEAHCGGCGLACAPSRICRRIPDSDGTGVLNGAACACRGQVGDPETSCDPPICERHYGQALCNCRDDGDCPGASICRVLGPDQHSYCDLPRG